MAEKKIKETVPGIRVKTPINGFRRGGRAWHGTTEVPLSEFTEIQLKQIRGEELLLTEDIDIDSVPDAVSD